MHLYRPSSIQHQRFYFYAHSNPVPTTPFKLDHSLIYLFFITNPQTAAKLWDLKQRELVWGLPSLPPPGATPAGRGPGTHSQGCRRRESCPTPPRRPRTRPSTIEKFKRSTPYGPFNSKKNLVFHEMWQ